MIKYSGRAKQLVVLLPAVLATSFLVAAVAQGATKDDRATANTFNGFYDITSQSTAMTGTCGNKPYNYKGNDYVFVQGGKVLKWHGEPTAPLHEAGQIYVWVARAKAVYGYDTTTYAFHFFLPLGPHNAHADLTINIDDVVDIPASSGETPCTEKTTYVVHAHRDPKSWIPQ